MPWALKIVKGLKKSMKVTTVFGGIHATLCPEIVDCDGVDIVCCGEGEYPMLDLLNSIDKGNDYFDINNFVYKSAKSIKCNQIRDNK